MIFYFQHPTTFLPLLRHHSFETKSILILWFVFSILRFFFYFFIIIFFFLLCNKFVHVLYNFDGIHSDNNNNDNNNNNVATTTAEETNLHCFVLSTLWRFINHTLRGAIKLYPHLQQISQQWVSNHQKDE